MILSQTAFTVIIVFGIVAGVVSLTTLVSLLISEKEIEYLKVTKRQTELEALLKEAKFNRLSAQIQPHFLFNSLNSISSLVRLGKNEEAAEATSSFSSLLRYTIRDSQELVPLEEEIFYVTQYLKIQKLRFGKRLDWKVHVDENAKTVKIPILSIQPLVENACKYGIEPKLAGGEISLTAIFNDGRLVVAIEDNGMGINPQVVQEFAEWKQTEIETRLLGIGIKNTQQRLWHYFGARGGLVIQRTPNGTMSVITIREGT